MILIKNALDNTSCAILSIKRRNVNEKQAYSADDIIKLQNEDLPQNGVNTAFNYIVSREYLIKNNIGFKEGMSYGEDTLWCFHVNFYNTLPVLHINQSLYFYRLRMGSAMRTKGIEMKKKHLESMRMMLETYQNIYKSSSITNEQRQHIKARIDWTVQNVCFDAVRLGKKECDSVINNLRVCGFYPYSFNRNRYSLKYGIKNFIINILACPLKFSWYLKFANFILGKKKS